MDFSHTFYYAGNQLTANLQNMVAQMIVPFTRDYIDHIKTVTNTTDSSEAEYRGYIPKRRSGVAAIEPSRLMVRTSHAQIMGRAV